MEVVQVDQSQQWALSWRHQGWGQLRCRSPGFHQSSSMLRQGSAEASHLKKANTGSSKDRSAIKKHGDHKTVNFSVHDLNSWCQIYRTENAILAGHYQISTQPRTKNFVKRVCFEFLIMAVHTHSVTVHEEETITVAVFLHVHIEWMRSI